MTWPDAKEKNSVSDDSLEDLLKRNIAAKEPQLHGLLYRLQGQLYHEPGAPVSMYILYKKCPAEVTPAWVWW